MSASNSASRTMFNLSSKKVKIKVVSSKVRVTIRVPRPRRKVNNLTTGPKTSEVLQQRSTHQEMAGDRSKRGPITARQKDHEARCSRTRNETPTARKTNFNAPPKRTVVLNPRSTYQEMAANRSKASPYTLQRQPLNETNRCVRTRVPTATIQEAVQDSRIAGPRNNSAYCPPQDWGPRRRSGGLKEQSISAPRRPTQGATDSPVNPIRCGNRSSAAPPRRFRTQESYAAKERSLDVTKLVSTKIPNAPFWRFFKEKVSLSQEDISWTSDTVNNFVPQILNEIRKKDERFGLRILNTGSYYERLKVFRPSEFDVMLVFDAHRLAPFFNVECSLRSRDCAGYAKLKFRNEVTGGRERWGQFLTSDGKCLSPRKTILHFYHLVRQARAAMSNTQRRRISNLILNGPAVTLTIDEKIDLDLVLSAEILAWPSCANSWGDFASNKTWPTKREVEEIKIINPVYYLVAKPRPSEEDIRDSYSHVYWRISFSKAEKTLLSKASSGCEKKFYRIAKAIFEAVKDYLKPLTSYHLKTLFLHVRRENPRAKSDESNLGESVVKFFASLIDRLNGGRLPHFFVQRADLLSRMSQETRLHLARRLEYVLYKLVKNPERFLEGLIF